MALILLIFTFFRLNSTIVRGNAFAWNTDKFLIFNLEELFFIPTVGVQELSIRATGRKDIKFYAHEQIKHLIITESVSTLKCTFYLCLIYENENQTISLKPLLIGTKPKLDFLKLIYNETNKFFE